MTSNPVGWFEIYVQDMSKAQAFYQSVLGVELSKLGDPTDMSTEMMAFPMEMEGAGAAGALVRMEGFPSGGNSTLVYFTCEDCANEVARVEKAGGRVEREKMSIGEYGFIALALDTEGNMFGLHSMK